MNGEARVMTHDEAFAELGAFSLGALESNEAALVQAHVSGCATCTAELEKMRAMVAEMSPPQLAPERSAAIRQRIVERAERSAAARPKQTRSGWLAAAASIVFFAAAAGYFGNRLVDERNALRLTAAREDSTIARLKSELNDRESQLALVTGPGVRVVQLGATGTPAPSARMFWNPATNRWAMFAQGMPQLKSGRAYELWLITSEAKIPAGVFIPRGDGSAVVQASYAMKPGDLKAIAVTEEPEAGVPSPTGPIVLVGSVGS